MLEYLFLNEEEIKLLTWEYPSLASILLFIISISFFLFLNAFFVANEFASARVRLSQLRENDEDTKKEANKRAKARNIVHHLDTYLSANQVGITLVLVLLIHRLRRLHMHFVKVRRHSVYPRQGFLLLTVLLCLQLHLSQILLMKLLQKQVRT